MTDILYKPPKNPTTQDRPESSLNFAQWLLTQTDRDDEVGEVAQDAARDQLLPLSPGSYGSLVRHLNRRGACEEALLALEFAYCEYPGD